MGPFELLEELGRGGQGVVYRARHVYTSDVYALKVLPDSSPDDRDRMRFRREAKALGLLVHANVVRYYGFDHDSETGQWYIVLEYVSGKTLAAQLEQRGQFDPVEAARIVSAVARGVHAAHQADVLHRDIKPGNVLMAQDGPKISDFGLAREIPGRKPWSAIDPLTSKYAPIGTPAYMSPEQVLADWKSINVSSDVYGLGALLYHLLVGRPPFMGDTNFGIMSNVLKNDLIRPRQLRLDIPANLEKVCLACLDKDPRYRYVSALALADDLDRVAAGQRPSIRGIPAWVRFWRWVRNHWIPFSFFVVTIIVATLVAGLVTQGKANRELNKANEAIVTLNGDIRRLNAQIVSDQAADRFRGGEPATAAFRLLAALRNTPPEKATQQWLIRTRLAVVAGTMHSLEHLFDAGREVRGLDLDYGPGRRRIIFGNGAGEIRAFHPDTGSESLLHVEPNETISALAVGPDGRMAAATDERSVLVRIPGKTGDQWQKRFSARCRPLIVTFPPGGDHLLIGGEPVFPGDISLAMYDLKTGDLVGKTFPVTGRVQAAAFDPKGKFVAAGGNRDNRVFVWDVAQQDRVLLETPEFPGPLFAVALFTDPGSGRTVLATGWRDGRIRLWDVTARRRLTPELVHDGPVRALAFSPDGRFLLSGSEDRTARLWDLTHYTQVGQALPHQGALGRVGFAPDGRMVTAGFDHTVRVWRPATARGEADVRVPANVSAVQVHRDGRRVLIAYRDRDGNLAEGREAGYTPGGAIVWDRQSGDRRVYPHQHEVTGATLNPVTDEFATADNRGNVSVWDLNTTRKIRSLKHHKDVVLTVTYDPTGQFLVFAGLGKTIGLYDRSTGLDRVIEWADPPSFIWTTRFSPDGKWLLADAGRALQLFNIADDAPVRGTAMFMENDRAAVRGSLFSPGGQAVVSLSYNGVVRVWDWRSGEKIRDLVRPGSSLSQGQAHQGQVVTAAYLSGVSGSARPMLGTGGADGRLRFWDTDAGGLAAPELPHDAAVSTFTQRSASRPDQPTQQLLAVGCADGWVWLWDCTEWTGGPVFFGSGPITHLQWLNPTQAASGPVLLIGSENGTVSATPIPPPLGGNPDDLQTRFELMTGLSPVAPANSTGIGTNILVGPPRALTPTEWLGLRARALEVIP